MNDCHPWKFESSISTMANRLMEADGIKQLVQKVNAGAKESLKLQTHPMVNPLEPTCHDLYNRVMTKTLKKKHIWTKVPLKFFHEQTYASMQKAIPKMSNIKKEQITLAQKCDYLIYQEDGKDGEFVNLCFSLELKRNTKTGPIKSDIPQMIRYLKAAMIL